MKASKTKSSKKASKKASKKVVKKELEDSITAKFMEAISDLGQDAKKIGKDIKKASKQIAKKLADKFKDIKNTADDSLSNGKQARIKELKKPLNTPLITSPKSITRAEGAVSRRTPATTEAKPKRTYTRRAANSSASPAGTAKKPRTVTATSPAKLTSGAKPADNAANGSVQPSAPASGQTPALPQINERPDQSQEETNNTL